MYLILKNSKKEKKYYVLVVRTGFRLDSGKEELKFINLTEQQGNYLHYQNNVPIVKDKTLEA